MSPPRGGKRGPKPGGGGKRGPKPGGGGRRGGGGGRGGERRDEGGEGGRRSARGGGGRQTSGGGRPATTGGRAGGGGGGGGGAPWLRQNDGPITDPGAVLFKIGLEHGMDLAHFLAMSVPGKLSVRKIRKFLEDGRCRVNGRIETFGSRKLYRNDVVSFVAPTTEEATHRFAYEAKRVLFDEHDLVAYDKPPGLPVTPTDAGTGPSLMGILRREMGDLLACHRLDADTSGIVLLARTRAVQARYEEAFRDHLVKKRYLALVRGRPPKSSGTLRSGLILVEQGAGYERWSSGKGQGALLAMTKWRFKEPAGNNAALIEIEPRTGRTHQIRVHMSELGHPLLGDKVYGDRKDPVRVSRHMLHAEQLSAPHPSGTGTLKLTTPRPGDFESAISKLTAKRKPSG